MTMRTFAIAPLALALGALCAFALGCGSKPNPALIPSGSAQRLDSELGALGDAVDAGRCSGVPERLSALQGSVAGLPARVDPRLRARLAQGVANLARIAPPECLDRAQQRTTPTTTTDTTTPTTPTTTVTTPTTTTPTTTAPTVTIPTTPVPTTPTPTTPTTPSGGAAAPTAP